ncbi:hypothetical protein DY124_05360 [Apilactobacillus micheneri]|uniref:hypothetical protein n=1 Tax=Apilactobacillus micheneri TaxID=1899430 RepID=UPI00112D0296|nr:hypothetical protein [Apilactobacillus micheneri]TPR43585.1 hypothetical protein DY124_05360 [Apilactobacillus micheneri]TPR47535.1 hypothetical protein DY125_05360 [Apilactobacillus micheneri]
MHCFIDLVEGAQITPTAYYMSSTEHILRLHIFINDDLRYIIDGTDDQTAKYIKNIMLKYHDEYFDNIDKVYIDSLDTNKSNLISIKKLNENEQSSEYEISFDVNF